MIKAAFKSLKRVLNASRFGAPVLNRLRLVYRPLRSRYLRRARPNGGYLEPNGVTVYCDFTNPSYAWYDSDSPDLAFDQLIIESLILQASGTVFVDIGAHFGFFASCAAALARRTSAISKVIACEPDREHFRCLEQTMRRFPDVESVLLPAAIGAFDGTINLYKSTDASCLHSYDDSTAAAVYAVEARTLDSIVAEYLTASESVGVIKIDVDGAEPTVLAGASVTLSTHRPILLMEFAPKFIQRGGNDPGEFFNSLTEQFHVYWVRLADRAITRIDAGDFETLAESIGDGITDLILSPSPLKNLGTTGP